MSKYYNYLFIGVWLAISLLTLSAKSIFPGNKEDVTIHIYAVTSVTMNQFKIDIYKSKHNIKLVYSLFDSLSRTALHQDTTYQRADLLLHHLSDSIDVEERLARFNNLTVIMDKYQVFDRDSITLKTSTDTSYVNLIKRIVAAPDERLQDPKNRGLLDGTAMSFTIITAQRERKAQTVSPNQKVNPLLYQLLTQSLHEYRMRKGTTFLNIKRTDGY